MKDPFTAMYRHAKLQDWIKDMSPQKRGVGFVRSVSTETGGMNVWWPKSGKAGWVILYNHGHYRVI